MINTYVRRKDQSLIYKETLPDARKRQIRLESKITSICENYKDGMSLRRIATIHKCSHEAIRQILINHKIYEKFEYKQIKIGDKKIDQQGYVHVFVGLGYQGANRSGWILEHRMVMQNHLGRPLQFWEIIHHKDRNKQNNEKTNLIVTTSAEHSTCLRCPYYEFYKQMTGKTMILDKD